MEHFAPSRTRRNSVAVRIQHLNHEEDRHDCTSHCLLVGCALTHC